MRETNPQQGTGAWFSARTGKLTGSRMRAAMAYLKAKKDGQREDKAERKNLKIEILSERLTGEIVQKYRNGAMEWGIEHEPLAKAEYEIRTGRKVLDVGFIDHPTIENLGASPDGFVEDGLIEVKCPTTATHLEYILDGGIPAEYVPQMTLQLLCAGREWCDFVSFDPRVPDHLQLFVRRFYPTEAQKEEIENEARQFLAEIDGLFEIISRTEMVENDI